MNSRIERKILTNKRHPKRPHLIWTMMRRIDSYGRMECRRLGLDPERWGSYTLAWPRKIRVMMCKVRGL